MPTEPPKPTNCCRFLSHGTQCVEASGHGGFHLFKCAGLSCPGFSWPASYVAHPAGCAKPGGKFDVHLEKLREQRRKGLAVFAEVTVEGCANHCPCFDAAVLKIIEMREKVEKLVARMEQPPEPNVHPLWRRG